MGRLMEEDRRDRVYPKGSETIEEDVQRGKGI